MGLAALVGVFAFMFLSAASAHAEIAKLTGSSTVTPSEQAKQFLANNWVTVEPTGAATFAAGVFTFPMVVGFGDPDTYDGGLAHAGGLRFSKGERSAVVRRPVAVRAGDAAVLLAQLPGLSGNCRHVRRALRRYCREGRVIVLARLTNLAEFVENGTATLTADLLLSRRAAHLINRVAGTNVVAAGAPLGTGVSTVTPAP